MALPVWPAELPALVAPPGFGSDEIVPEGAATEFEGGNIRIRRRTLVSATTRPMQLPLSRILFPLFLDFLQRDLNGGVRRFVAPIRLPSGLLGLRICQIVGKVSESDRGPYSVVSFAVRISGWDAYEPEANAFLAQVSAAPDATRKALISSTIARLKYAGLWAKIGVLQLYAAHTVSASRRNLVNPATFLATSSGGPPTATLSTDLGYLGDGVGAYLDLGAGYASVPGIAIDNLSVLVWSLTDGDGGSGCEAGTVSGLSTFIQTRNANAIRLRAAMTTSIVVPSTNGTGLIGFARRGTTVDVIRNGIILQSVEAAASAYGTGNISVLRSNTSYSARRIAAYVCAQGLTAAESAALYDILRRYMTEIGVVA